MTDVNHDARLSVLEENGSGNLKMVVYGGGRERERESKTERERE